MLSIVWTTGASSIPFKTSVQHCSTFAEHQMLQEDVEPCVIISLRMTFRWVTHHFQVRHETRVGSHYGINFLRKTCCIRLKRKCNVHGMYTVFKKCLGKLECFNPRDSMSRFSYVIHRWFARDVIAAILVDESKRSLISSLRSSTSNCALRHRQEMKIIYLGVFKTKYNFAQS